jgi:hypothetical protein
MGVGSDFDAAMALSCITGPALPENGIAGMKKMIWVKKKA